MKAKKKSKVKAASAPKTERLSLNNGAINIRVEKDGSVWDGGDRALKASDLDLLAKLSSINLRRYNDESKTSADAPVETQNGHSIRYRYSGDVEFGCQRISAEQVARVHKLSLAMRKRNKS